MIQRTAKEYSMYLLSSRERTQSEIRKKLKEKNYPEIEINQVVSWLKEKKFLDDKRFVEIYVRHKISLGSTGKYKIKQKLILSGVDPEIIEEELLKYSSETDKNNATVLAEKWIKKNKETDSQKRYEKLGRHLVSKGFDYETVKGVLNQFKI